MVLKLPPRVCVASGLSVLAILAGLLGWATPSAAQSAPTPPPMLLATAIPAGGQTSYEVKQGDTLFSIARAFGVKTADIQALNNLADSNAIKSGQIILIPAAGQPPPAATPQQPAATPQQPTASSQPQQPTAVPSPSPSPSAPASPSPTVVSEVPQPKDAWYFGETGFRIANEQFWNYFNRRGGVRTFGYPISKEFLLFGFRVQFFQRLIMQLKPDGSVSTMNLLDDGMMPYTRVNGSTFPGPDNGLAEAAPKPGQDGYFEKLLDFVKEKSPDKWENLPTDFHKTFNETVRYEDAYPDGKMDRGIMPAINLELWGVPISPPAYDPNNKNFVYLRFQRGIMHYDKTSGATQGLLLGDILKSIITGINLPSDLEEQAKGSRFYRQYNPLAANGLNRPNDLPGTDMRTAFSRDGLVVIDPGHGGTEIGAAHGYADGTILQEKNVNLKLAQKVADILRRSGRQVMLTRNTDSTVNNPPKDLTGDKKATLDDDLQARIDIANNSGATLFLSIHFNGSSNPDFNGVEIYYNAKRPFSDKNKGFAQLLLENAIVSTKAAGYNLQNRGVKEDERAVGQGNSFYLLGPTDEDKPRAAHDGGRPWPREPFSPTKAMRRW